MDDLKVRDLMLLLKEYATVSSDATIQEALVSLSKSQLGLTNSRHHHRAILALDARGRVVGKLSHWAILRSLEPQFFREADVESLVASGLSQEFIDSMIDNSRQVQTSLKSLCAAAATIKVKDAMAPVDERIEADAPLIEAIHLLTQSRAQSVLVTEGGETAGILRASDLFEEVADLIRAGEISADSA